MNGRTRSMLSYLADGIHPRYPFPVTPFPVPTTQRHNVFNRLQEALRKDVEHLFGVLTDRFRIALHPGRYPSIAQHDTTSLAVAILHDMIVEVRRDGYLGSRRAAAASFIDEGGLDSLRQRWRQLSRVARWVLDDHLPERSLDLCSERDASRNAHELPPLTRWGF